MTPAQLLAILLALSVAGNAALTFTYLGVRDERTAATGERDQARSAASMCSDAVEDLRELADKRQAENKRAVAAAYARGQVHARKAQEILGTLPSRPGDDCGSAGDRFNRWISERSTP